MIDFIKNGDKRALLSLGVSLAALAASFFGFAPISAFGHAVDVAWVSILLCGLPILFGAVSGLVTAFDVKADVLVSIALVASVVIGETFAAGEIAFIMAVGAHLEERTVAKARAGIERLVRLTPTVARVVRDGEEAIIPAADVRVGDALRVLAGETIAVDGIVTCGQTSVDQSVMTGESLPVDKAEGDDVMSGTVNMFGTFDMVAGKVGEDSSLQRMVRLVESADAGKAKIVGIADRWATWIVGIALATALVTGFATGDAIRAVTILVVFCPCALVLATPTAIMAGIGNAARHGILIRQGDALERLASVARVAFDKTGTLTYGRPAVAAVKAFDPKTSEAELLRIAASAELRSEHPLGKAIVAHCSQAESVALVQPEGFRMMAGLGVSAVVGGSAVLAGNAALLAAGGVTLPESAKAAAAEADASGGTAIYVSAAGRALGMVTLSDTLRPDAPGTIKAIADAGADTLLLTGDTEGAAMRVAALAGIADVRAGCLPEDKLNAVKAYMAQGEPVCMVGDGINDAPALKAAHVGIAMGGIGSDIAIEAADAALVGDDIKALPHLLLLSRKVMRTIKANLAVSMLLNFAAIILAIAGILNPVMGALVHNAGSVAVIVNSSLLLKWSEAGRGLRRSPIQRRR